VVLGSKSLYFCKLDGDGLVLSFLKLGHLLLSASSWTNHVSKCMPRLGHGEISKLTKLPLGKAVVLYKVSI
jgi:hypothetical protein